MNTEYIEEPLLEFGTGKHIDVRHGMMEYATLDYAHPQHRSINVAIIGSSESVEGAENWFERCHNEIPAKLSNQPNLFPRFPGFNSSIAFYPVIRTADEYRRILSQSDIDKLLSIESYEEFILETVQVFLNEIRYLSEKPIPPDVILCAPPMELAARLLENNDTSWQSDDAAKLDFHDLLKATAMSIMQLRPIQLILPTTYDSTKKRKQKKKPGRDKEI